MQEESLMEGEGPCQQVGPGISMLGGLAGVTWPKGPGPDGFLLAYTKHLMSPRLAALLVPTPGWGLSSSVKDCTNSSSCHFQWCPPPPKVPVVPKDAHHPTRASAPSRGASSPQRCT